jgi:hypothetical protein
MTRRHVGIHLRAAVVAASWALGCASDPAGGAAAGKTARSASKCAADTECPAGFCDQGYCAAIDAAHVYGIACAPVPAGTSEPGKLDTCGAYRCQAGRCRSCTSNEACQGAGECYKSPELPGMRCGLK